MKTKGKQRTVHNIYDGWWWLRSLMQLFLQHIHKTVIWLKQSYCSVSIWYEHVPNLLTRNFDVWKIGMFCCCCLFQNYSYNSKYSSNVFYSSRFIFQLSIYIKAWCSCLTYLPDKDNWKLIILLIQIIGELGPEV